MTARDAETPRDYSEVSQESPREICGNLAMIFRAMDALEQSDPRLHTAYNFPAWASRLEDACRKLDAER